MQNGWRFIRSRALQLFLKIDAFFASRIRHAWKIKTQPDPIGPHCWRPVYGIDVVSENL